MTASLTQPTIGCSPALRFPMLKYIAVWFAAVHTLGFAGIAYLCVQWNVATLALGFGMLLFSALGITSIHRRFSHKSFVAKITFDVVNVCLASAAFAYSKLEWCQEHIKHHWYTNKYGDPYSILDGFWWAHWLWIFRNRVPLDEEVVGDLMQNRLLAFEHKYYYYVATTFGLLLPTGIASLWGDPIGGLLVGGFSRLVVQYHTMWCINSLVHWWGMYRHSHLDTTPYSVAMRILMFIVLDVILAIFTGGESCDHGNHHNADDDPRITPRRWALDLGMWWIYLWRLVGQVPHINFVSDDERQRRDRARVTSIPLVA